MKVSPLSKGLRLVVAVALSAVVTLASSPTSAQTVPDCSTLNLPNPIYGDGGSAAQQYIGKLATVLANLPTPITVLFKASGGCAAVYGLETPTTLSGSIFYWDATGAQKSCNLPAVGGPAQTWGNMVNSHLVCANSPATLPANIRVEEGPVTAVNFITSTASTETSISSEAAYFVFGFGNNSNVPPWTSETFLFHRNQNSAVGLYAGLADRGAAELAEGRRGQQPERRHHRRGRGDAAVRGPLLRQQRRRRRRARHREDARVPAQGPDLRLSARFDEHELRQEEPARRPLLDLGRKPLLRRFRTRRRKPGPIPTSAS